MLLRIQRSRRIGKSDGVGTKSLATTGVDLPIHAERMLAQNRKLSSIGLWPPYRKLGHPLCSARYHIFPNTALEQLHTLHLRISVSKFFGLLD